MRSTVQSATETAGSGTHLRRPPPYSRAAGEDGVDRHVAHAMARDLPHGGESSNSVMPMS